MSRIFVTNPVRGAVYQIDAADLAKIIKGTSIVSLADSERYIEFGLSENLMVRIERGEGEHITSPQVSVFSTLSPDEILPVRVQLINDDETPGAAIFGGRLANLRQAYAIIVLLHSGRQDELAEVLLKEPHIDIEQGFLGGDEQLAVEAAGPGSFWVVLKTIGDQIQAAPQLALNTISLIYGEGREMILRRVRAATAVAEAKAFAAQIAAEKTEDDRILALVAALNKVKNAEGKAIIEKRLISAMTEANQKIVGPNIAGLLSGPANSST